MQTNADTDQLSDPTERCPVTSDVHGDDTLMSLSIHTPVPPHSEPTTNERPMLEGGSLSTKTEREQVTKHTRQVLNENAEAAHKMPLKVVPCIH